jgi:hypothetical protein
MRQAIEEISEEIANQTNLSRESWYLLPGYWGFRPHSGSPLMSWEDEFGYAFEAGLHGLTWRFGIGSKCQLLSDATLIIHAGYNFDRLIHGRDANTMDGPHGWNDQKSAANGSPSCNEVAEGLIVELKANLPAMVEQFAVLLEADSK